MIDCDLVCVSQINPFLSVLFLIMVFITLIKSRLGQVMWAELAQMKKGLSMMCSKDGDWTVIENLPRRKGPKAHGKGVRTWKALEFAESHVLYTAIVRATAPGQYSTGESRLTAWDIVGGARAWAEEDCKAHLIAYKRDDSLLKQCNC